MLNVLDTFLKGRRDGQSSLNEFFLSLCRETGVPPLPKYEAECARLLTTKHLLKDGTVAVYVPGRKRPTIRVANVEDIEDDQ